MKPEQVLAGIESFATARVIGKLAGGPASDSYLVESEARRFVLRIDTAVAVEFGLDRTAEAQIIEFISRNELGPNLEFVDPERGILMTRYVDGRTWAEADLKDAEQIRELADLLRRLHALEPVGRPFDLNDKIENYARIIDTSQGRELAEITRQLISDLDDQSVKQCLCHNDLTSANIIEGKRLVLIDWEYAAIGDPMFDMATVTEHHRFDRVQADALLAGYFGTAHAEDVRRLNRYRMLYRHLLVLWLESVEQLCGISPQDQVHLRHARNHLSSNDVF